MPELDGFGTIKILNKQWPSIKTIIFSMFCNEFSMIRMICSGARGYIPKNAPIGELCKAVDQVQKFGYYYSDLESSILTFQDETQDLKKFIFSEKDLSFMKLCSSELAYKEIAHQMNLSLPTVATYRNELFERLNVKSRIGLVMFAVKAGIVPI